jgi:hypothetical protein
VAIEEIEVMFRTQEVMLSVSPAGHASQADYIILHKQQTLEISQSES